MRKTSEKDATQSGNSRTILIIEDYPHIVEVLKMRLEAAGYNVLVAYDGFEGLKLARERRPSLIILDIMLPKMDGYKVCRFLKFDQRYKDIPVFVLTSRTKKSDQELGKKVGADEYFTKPYEPRLLMAKIDEYLSKPRAVANEQAR
ncbi:MAG TPA: response regulator [Bacteroidetes bacterium]|nr:response regulator [Bacteroidota bacterium]